MPLKSRYNANFSGDVTYGKEVVISTISLAAKEINGVASLNGKSIRTEMLNDKMNIDVFINVYSYCCCPDVAFRVQENIKRSVEGVTSCKVGQVNVNILGVDFSQGAETNQQQNNEESL